jgi:hypothetical protein
MLQGRLNVFDECLGLLEQLTVRRLLKIPAQCPWLSLRVPALRRFRR